MWPVRFQCARPTSLYIKIYQLISLVGLCNCCIILELRIVSLLYFTYKCTTLTSYDKIIDKKKCREIEYTQMRVDYKLIT